MGTQQESNVYVMPLYQYLIQRLGKYHCRKLRIWIIY